MALAAFLLAPVGGDTEFGVLVHFLGTNLDFQAASVRSDPVFHFRRHLAVDLAVNEAVFIACALVFIFNPILSQVYKVIVPAVGAY